MYSISTGTHVADNQIADLSATEVGALAEVYEVLRLTPGNGRKHVPTGNMYSWDYKGLSVTYIVLEEQREVAVLLVDRWPC